MCYLNIKWWVWDKYTEAKAPLCWWCILTFSGHFIKKVWISWIDQTPIHCSLTQLGRKIGNVKVKLAPSSGKQRYCREKCPDRKSHLHKVPLLETCSSCIQVRRCVVWVNTSMKYVVLPLGTSWLTFYFSMFSSTRSIPQLELLFPLVPDTREPTSSKYCYKEPEIQEIFVKWCRLDDAGLNVQCLNQIVWKLHSELRASKVISLGSGTFPHNTKWLKNRK